MLSRIEATSRPTNSKALIIEKFSNFSDKNNFVLLIVTPITSSFYRIKLIKLLLPIPQNVGLYVTKAANFPDGKVTL